VPTSGKNEKSRGRGGGGGKKGKGGRRVWSLRLLSGGKARLGKNPRVRTAFGLSQEGLPHTLTNLRKEKEERVFSIWLISKENGKRGVEGRKMTWGRETWEERTKQWRLDEGRGEKRGDMKETFSFYSRTQKKEEGMQAEKIGDKLRTGMGKVKCQGETAGRVEGEALPFPSNQEGGN